MATRAEYKCREGIAGEYGKNDNKNGERERNNGRTTNRKVDTFLGESGSLIY